MWGRPALLEWVSSKAVTWRRERDYLVQPEYVDWEQPSAPVAGMGRVSQ